MLLFEMVSRMSCRAVNSSEECVTTDVEGV